MTKKWLNASLLISIVVLWISIGNEINHLTPSVDPVHFPKQTNSDDMAHLNLDSLIQMNPFKLLRSGSENSENEKINHRKVESIPPEFQLIGILNGTTCQVITVEWIDGTHAEFITGDTLDKNWIVERIYSDSILISSTTGLHQSIRIHP